MPLQSRMQFGINFWSGLFFSKTVFFSIFLKALMRPV